MPYSLLRSFGRVLAAILIAIGWNTLAPTCFAQSATGTPPFGSFAGGPDVVNLANLNAHYAIPVLNKAGRGTNFFYNLVYDSSVWYPVTINGSQTWQPVWNWGWAGQTQVTTGYISYSTTQVQVTCTTGGRIVYQYYLSQYTYTSYFDSFGVAHPLNVTVSQPLNNRNYTNCTPTSVPPPTATVFANDGSGMEFYLTYTLSADTVYLGNGRSISPPLIVGTGAGSYTDRNGNIVNVNTSGQFFDTLSSATPVLTVSGQGTASSPMNFTYTPPNTSSSRCASTNTTGVACYTLNYTNYTVATNFGASIVEYPATAVPLVSSVVLPDGSQYTFAYEPTPSTPSPGQCTPRSGTYQANCVTARLASVTLPTGGTISYNYYNLNNDFPACTAGHNGIFSDGSASCLQRTLNDGTNSNTWTYVRSQGSGAASTTTMTDPSAQANQTVIQFQGIYETERQVYSGSQSGGNLLRQWTTCYNTNFSNCNGTAITLPIQQRNVNDQYGSNGLQCQHNYWYNTVGGLLEQDDYDYGSGAYGALLKKTLITYAPLGNITAFRQTVTVCNGTGSSSSCQGPSGSTTAGTVVAQTNYNYDQGTLQSTSGLGLVQRGPVSGSRGNLTSINYPVSGLTASFAYYDTGSPYTSTDVNNATTTYNYSGNTADCQMAFPTSISEPLSLSRSMTWNCTGGVQLTSVDENTQTTTTAYTDPYFWRPAQQNFPDGGQTSWAYNNQTSLTTTTKMNASQNIVSTVVLDGLGRTKETQLNSDPEGADYQDTTYDALGRVASVTNPYRSTGDPTYGVTSYQYDAIGRATKVIPPDGSSSTDNISASYSNNTTTITDQAGNTRQSTLDALGRLAQVLEDPGTSPHMNYETDYGYDALGNLLCVGQKGTNSGTFSGCASIPSGWRARNYGWDAMSRLTSETNPESGTTTYYWDSASGTGCQSSSPGDILKKVDAKGNWVCYDHDLLHRLTDVGNNNPSATNACKRFRYDNTNGVLGSKPSGVSVSNPYGRLVEAETDTCAWPITQSSLVTDQWFSYDTMGRGTQDWQETPGLAPNGDLLSYTYDLAGDTLSASNGVGVTISYGYDTAGRPTGVTSSLVDANHPATLATVDSSVGYYPPGAVRKMTFGNSLTQTAALNNALQPCRINVNSSSVALGTCADAIPSGNVQDFNYGFNAGTSDNGNVAGWTATGQQAFSRSFGYDAVNRLASLNQSSGNATSCSSTFSLTWGYDAWGNRTDQNVTGGTCNQFHATVNSNNQLSGSPYLYDANGNMTSDGNHTYFYDAENRLAQVDGTLGTCSTATACYFFDALGNRVDKQTGSYHLSYLHDLSGSAVTEYCAPCTWGTGWNRGYVFMSGQQIAEYANGTTYFVHRDHLGSTRLMTALNQSIYANMDFLPFGEQIAGGTGSSHKFTGDERDSETNLDHTQFRQYSSQLGRWMHPDPAGLAAVNPSNPQSWNRYSYVLNRPLSLVDPFGLDCVFLDSTGGTQAGGTDGFEIDDSLSQQDCSKAGGVWAPGTVSFVSTDPNSNSVQIGTNQGITFGEPGNSSEIFFPANEIQGNNELDTLLETINWGPRTLNLNSRGGCTINSMQDSLSPGNQAEGGFYYMIALLASKVAPTFAVFSAPAASLGGAEIKATATCAGLP